MPCRMSASLLMRSNGIPPKGACVFAALIVMFSNARVHVTISPETVQGFWCQTFPSSEQQAVSYERRLHSCFSLLWMLDVWFILIIPLADLSYKDRQYISVCQCDERVCVNRNVLSYSQAQRFVRAASVVTFSVALMFLNYFSYDKRIINLYLDALKIFSA